MSSHSYTRAPHVEGAARSHHHSDAPNAALLIDFDNVTMGMRSDLSKELKNLLNSDIIRGKVTVQRAYADWRRYPQYIVPLSEASIDLIFAPAYGSSKKNATDIRMAIDGMELVFIRPEIGTYILLTGDSDFSSLVLKLKEYGKYVIGVGIQESSSDILVQNCDEYYSYTSLTGLRKSGDSDRSGMDPWVLVEKALEQMKRRNDVMRSDRLKQVMLELDAGFDEGSLGFSKFSRFLTEASSRGLVRLKRMENGQYELSQPSGSARREPETPKESDGRKSSDGRKTTRSGRSRRSGGDALGADGTPSGATGTSDAAAPPAATVPTPTPPTRGGESAASGAPDAGSMVGGELAPLAKAYDLLRRAMEELGGDTPGEGIRDSDVKRKMLAMERGFDEAEYGFSKFSRFLRQAHDHEVLDLTKTEDGNYHVTLKPGGGPAAQVVEEGQGSPVSDGGPQAPASTPARSAESRSAQPAASKPAAKAAGASTDSGGARRLNPRVSSRRSGRSDTPPPLLEGQIVGAVSTSASSASSGKAGSDSSGSAPSEAATPKSAPSRSTSASPSAGPPAEGVATVDPTALALPTDPDSVVQYLSNSYRGVGRKTAETLVEAFGDNLFQVLQEQPERVKQVVPENRAEKVLEGWNADYARRGGASGAPSGGTPDSQPRGRSDSPPRGGSESQSSGTSESQPGGRSDSQAATDPDGQDEAAPPRRTRGRTRRTRGGSGS